MRHAKFFVLNITALVTALVAFSPAGAARDAGPVYAIKGARVFTATGTPIARYAGA